LRNVLAVRKSQSGPADNEDLICYTILGIRSLRPAILDGIRYRLSILAPPDMVRTIIEQADDLFNDLIKAIKPGGVR